MPSGTCRVQFKLYAVMNIQYLYILWSNIYVCVYNIYKEREKTLNYTATKSDVDVSEEIGISLCIEYFTLDTVPLH